MTFIWLPGALSIIVWSPWPVVELASELSWGQVRYNVYIRVFNTLRCASKYRFYLLTFMSINVCMKRRKAREPTHPRYLYEHRSQANKLNWCSQPASRSDIWILRGFSTCSINALVLVTTTPNSTEKPLSFLCLLIVHWDQPIHSNRVWATIHKSILDVERYNRQRDVEGVAYGWQKRCIWREKKEDKLCY